MYAATVSFVSLLMLYATIVSTETELEQIQRLNQQNLKNNISREEQEWEGFVSWSYSFDLLKKMHQQAPSIIVKDGDEVIGYALVTLLEASDFHKDLQTMISNLRSVQYNGKSLMLYRFYLMGQVCIQKEYRGKGVFNLLYQQHKNVYRKEYELLVTEIAANNKRSLRAHKKIGFDVIHTYPDGDQAWNVVVWNWFNRVSN